MKSNDRKFYMHVMKSEECQCGREKRCGQALCWHCFKRLPGYMQQELYRPIGAGFEIAYEDAVQRLS